MPAAVATVTVATINQTWKSDKMFVVWGTVAISADPATYTTDGIVMSFAHPLIKASRTPVIVNVRGIAGYIYSYIKGTDAFNGLLRVFAQTNAAAEDAPLGQLTGAAAIPAGVSGDTITFEATFLGMN